jgi:tRNA dimethylallyltransferase
MELARRFGDVELVSVDSMQVYRGMDIGTAKPTAADRAEVPHHLLDLVDPWEPFDLHRFQQAVRAALADIGRRGRWAILVGGTGLYLRSVVDDLDLPGRYPDVLATLDADPDTGALHRRLTGLDPLAASRMEPTNRRRIVRALEVTLGSGRPFSSFGPGLDRYGPGRIDMVGLWRPRPVIAERIALRYAEQVAAGFVDEVRRLADGPPLSPTAAQALGYRELLAHVRGECPLDVALDAAVGRTRRFARRQRVWFKRDPRITWFGADRDPMVVLPLLLRHLDESRAANR